MESNYIRKDTVLFFENGIRATLVRDVVVAVGHHQLVGLRLVAHVDAGRRRQVIRHEAVAAVDRTGRRARQLPAVVIAWDTYNQIHAIIHVQKLTLSTKLNLVGLIGLD